MRAGGIGNTGPKPGSVRVVNSEEIGEGGPCFNKRID